MITEAYGEKPDLVTGSDRVSPIRELIEANFACLENTKDIISDLEQTLGPIRYKSPDKSVPLKDNNHEIDPEQSDLERSLSQIHERIHEINSILVKLHKELRI